MKKSIINDGKFVLGKLSEIVELFLGHTQLPRTMKMFRIVFYTWLFYHTIVLIPYLDQIWGHEAFFTRKVFSGGADWIDGILQHPVFQPYYREIVYLYLLFLVVGVLGIIPSLIGPIIWYLMLNIDNHSYPILDGGNNLSHLLAFFLIFINTSGKPITGTHPLKVLRIGVSNFAIMAAKLQVAFVYLCAGWYKLSGSLWQSGMSLYYLAQNEDYSRPWFAEFITNNLWLSTISTYSVVFFQIAFPILVWFRKARPFLLIFGTIFHLGIAFGMGLFSFGLIMCISYIIFFRDSWIISIQKSFDFKGELIVGFDEKCTICQKFAHIVKRMDIRRTIIVDGAHHPAHGKMQDIDYQSRTIAIQAWDEGQQGYFSGFDAIALIFGKLVLTRPFYPLLKVIGYTGLGDLIYKKIAESQLRKGCSQGECSLPARPSNV